MAKTIILLAASIATVSVTMLACVSVSAALQHGTISQGYNFKPDNGALVPGALVSLNTVDPESIELATTQSADRLVGITASSPSLSLATDKHQAQVVISGTMVTLVSDLNGRITPGDKITPSPVAGVGMKAIRSAQIAGTAQSGFTKSETRTITDSEGKERDINIGYVTLQVGSSYYQAPGSDILPPALQRLADSLAGHPVSLTRILIATMILLAGLSAVVTLAYSSMRYSIISIGRNPLAAVSIRRELLKVLLAALLIVCGTTTASYMVMTF